MSQVRLLDEFERATDAEARRNERGRHRLRELRLRPDRDAAEAARDEAKLPAHLTLHDLRHAAASRLIHPGLSPVTVAAVLGHEDATTTLRVYAHLFDRQKTDEAVRAALSGQTG